MLGKFKDKIEIWSTISGATVGSVSSTGKQLVLPYLLLYEYSNTWIRAAYCTCKRCTTI